MDRQYWREHLFHLSDPFFGVFFVFEIYCVVVVFAGVAIDVQVTYPLFALPPL